MKLLVIGYDAVGAELLRSVPAVKDFVVKDLDVEVPLSGPSWFSIYTGLSVVEHEVYDALGYGDEGSKTYSDLGGRMVWDVLGKAGYTVALCGLPCAVPPREVRGFHASGFPADPLALVWPPELLLPARWLKMVDLGHYGSYLVNRGWGADWGQIVSNLGTVADILSMVRSDCVAVAEWFVEHSRQADFGWIAFTFKDRLGHRWGLTNTVKGACGVIITETLEMLRNLYPEDIMIVSDHSFRPVQKGIGVEGHTVPAVIAATSDDLIEGVDSVLDVSSAILRAFGMPHLVLPCTRATPEEVAEAESIMMKRLEGLGYV